MARKNVLGFTLIELIVVVAIVGILAAIAMPMYANQVRKSRRTEAMTTLQDQQLKLERFRTDAPSYAGYSMPATLNTDYYTFALTGASPTAYTLTATPLGEQAKDPCGTLTIANAAGTISKTPTGGTCW